MTEQQLNLFEMLSEDTAPEPAPKPEPEPDSNDWCLIYLVTMNGGNQGNLFILHREDAIKLCEDECSHGSARQGKWMFCWTSLSHFYDSNDRSKADRQARNVHGVLEPFVFIPDTGKQDKDFERLGIVKPNIREMSKILSECGYELKYKSSKERLIESGLSTPESFAETEKQIADYIKNKRGTKNNV